MSTPGSGCHHLLLLQPRPSFPTWLRHSQVLGIWNYTTTKWTNQQNQNLFLQFTRLLWQVMLSLVQWIWIQSMCQCPSTGRVSPKQTSGPHPQSFRPCPENLHLTTLGWSWSLQTIVRTSGLAVWHFWVLLKKSLVSYVKSNNSLWREGLFFHYSQKQITKNVNHVFVCICNTAVSCQMRHRTWS